MHSKDHIVLIPMIFALVTLMFTSAVISNSLQGKMNQKIHKLYDTIEQLNLAPTDSNIPYEKIAWSFPEHIQTLLPLKEFDIETAYTLGGSPAIALQDILITDCHNNPSILYLPRTQEVANMENIKTNPYSTLCIFQSSTAPSVSSLDINSTQTRHPYSNQLQEIPITQNTQLIVDTLKPIIPSQGLSAPLFNSEGKVTGYQTQEGVFSSNALENLTTLFRVAKQSLNSIFYIQNNHLFVVESSTLIPGDILISINNNAIYTLDQYTTALNTEEDIEATIIRNGTEIQVLLQTLIHSQL